MLVDTLWQIPKEPVCDRTCLSHGVNPAAKKRANRVRALLGQAPKLTSAEQQTWNPPPDPELEIVAPEVKPAHSVLCPHCQKAMRMVGSWHPGRMLLYPNRPP